MSINNIAFKEATTDELDKKLVSGTVTGFLADNNLHAKFIGAKTVNIPVLGMNGMGDYDRDTGFARGSVSVTHTPFTLQMDRGRSFQIDAQDVDESGIADLAGQIMGEFVRTKVVPEVDAYVLSKLAGYAYSMGQVVQGNLPSETYKILTNAIANVRNVVGYDEELVAFVNNDIFTKLQNSQEISRHLVMNDFKKGELHTQVTSLNGVAILPVVDNCMKSAYDFYDGTTSGQEAGGFVPADGAKSVGILIMPRRGASLIKKTEQVRTFTPENNQSADAWKLDYRLYYDVFVKDSMKGGICAFIY